MKIEKLSLNKIKVTVSPRDLSSWDISFDALTPDSPQLREFILSLVRQAEYETGFEGVGGSLMIEAIPFNNEFIFFITKVDSDQKHSMQDSGTIYRQSLRKKLRTKDFRVAKKTVSKTYPANTASDYIYSFDSFEDFLALFNAISDTTAFNSSALYKYSGKYYINAGSMQDGLYAMDSLICEFATLSADKLLGARLAEHGILIAKNESFNTIKDCFR